MGVEFVKSTYSWIFPTFFSDFPVLTNTTSTSTSNSTSKKCSVALLISLALGQSARHRFEPKPITIFALRHHHRRKFSKSCRFGKSILQDYGSRKDNWTARPRFPPLVNSFVYGRTRHGSELFWWLCLNYYWVNLNQTLNVSLSRQHFSFRHSLHEFFWGF